MKRLLVLLVFLLTACARIPTGAPLEPIDPSRLIIFYNGVILTMNADQPVVEAIVLRGEKIEALGTDAEILALQTDGATLIDLAGRSLMPGFVDAHSHILNDARSQGMSLDEAQYLALKNGITSLGDLYVDEPFLRELQAFASRDELRLRTSLYLVANTNCGDDQGLWYKKYPPTRRPGEMLRINGVKIFTDGGSCGGVALSFELEAGKGQGDLWLTQAELNDKVTTAQAAGYQVAIHAIGDRAVAQAQQALAVALDGGPNIYRHRMEHLSVLRPELIPRFGELGIVPVLNGQYPSCAPFGPPIPEGYREWEWPWRELRRANPALPIAWHSDYPFLSTNPFVHLYGFVTRRDVFQRYSCPPADWLLDDTLTVQQALSIMTRESAYALFREEEVGSLLPGKYADVIVLSGNPLTTPDEKLKDLSVRATMVGGRFEYCYPRNPELCPAYPQRTPQPLPDLRPPLPIRWLALLLASGLALSAGLAAWRPAARRERLRLGGIGGVLGGGLWLWLFALGLQDSQEWIAWPLLGAGALLPFAMVGLAGAARPGRLGQFGVAAAGLGIFITGVSTALSEWFKLDDAWLWIGLGLLGHLAGLILLGLDYWRAGRRGLRQRLPLAVGLGGLLSILGGSMAGESAWPIILLSGVLGLGWIGMGLLTLAAESVESERTA